MKTATTTSTMRALAHAGSVPDPEIPEKAKRRRFSVQYKLDILDEYDRLSEPGAKGALLQREGCTRRTSWSGAGPETSVPWPSWPSLGAESAVSAE
jgi:hypothetical protein